MGWFQIGKGVCQGCILPPCLFNLHAEKEMATHSSVPAWRIPWTEKPGRHRVGHDWSDTAAEYNMWNAGLDEAQAGIKLVKRNINNLRYDTTLTVESEEELKSLLMKVKEESEKMKIMASGLSLHGK